MKMITLHNIRPQPRQYPTMYYCLHVHLYHARVPFSRVLIYTPIDYSLHIPNNATCRPRTTTIAVDAAADVDCHRRRTGPKEIFAMWSLSLEA